jgi:hypothetical protein
MPWWGQDAFGIHRPYVTPSATASATQHRHPAAPYVWSLKGGVVM